MKTTNLHIGCLLVAMFSGPAVGRASTWLVGPDFGGGCGGVDCHYFSIQQAIDVASPGDSIFVYRRTDQPLTNGCYDEHLVIDKPLEIIGADLTAPPCVGTSTPGDIVLITSNDVLLKHLELSGKANDGNGGENATGSGGRADGHGVHVYGDDIDNARIINCTIDYTFGDNIRFFGDRDEDGDGYLEVRRCYLHHSDTGRNIKLLRGGGSAADRHVVRGNLVHTGLGILVDDADYATVEGNVIKGWAFWGHLAGGDFPETRDAAHGGGWRYYSNCTAGIFATRSAAADLLIQHNLIIATCTGIRLNDSGTVRHNTIVNPFDLTWYDPVAPDPVAVRERTYGIMLGNGFNGTVENNLIVVTPDNRANGMPGQGVAPYYTPGITGYGIAFENDTGALGTASISSNNVWGFVDTDGATVLNFGSGIPMGNNLSMDPGFATDDSGESNGGTAPCPADAEGTRCHELYEDNFFLASTRPAGSCHAHALPNTAGAVGFVDLTSGGMGEVPGDPFAAFGNCVAAADATASAAIDAGQGAVGSEPERNGDAPNLGAFGATVRASRTPFLKLVAVDVGTAGVKNGSSAVMQPGLVQPRLGGLTEVNLYFNRPPTTASGSFEIRNYIETIMLPAPTVDTSAADSTPHRITLRWPAGILLDKAVRVRALASGPSAIVDVELDAFDGDITDPLNGPLPSGNSTAGGTAEFVVFALLGDVDGDGTVEGWPGQDDYTRITGFPAYPAGACTGCPEDIDADGDVDADDLAYVIANNGKTPSLGGINVAGSALAPDNAPLTGTARTVTIRRNGAAATSTSTSSVDGSWMFTDYDADAGDVLSVYLDGQSERANLIFVSDGSTHIAAASLVQDQLTLQADAGSGPIDISDLGDYDNDDDAANMLYTANGPMLTLDAGSRLHISAGTTFAPNGAVSVDGSVNISGTWTATGAETIQVNGDWIQPGTFNAAGSTVTVAGTGTSTIGGSPTFFNLTCITPGKILRFDAGQTTTVAGVLRMQGAADNLLFLRSSAAGTAFGLQAAAIADAQSNPSFRYLDVADSAAGGAAANFAALSSQDSGGNTQWDFPVSAQADFCYDSYLAGWDFKPGNMADCNETTFARTTTSADLQELVTHTLQTGVAGPGEIVSVAMRYRGARRGSGSSANRATLTPIFNGADFGLLYDPGPILPSTREGDFTPWIDITADPSAPPSWSWNDVNALDLDVRAIVGGGRLMVHIVQLRVGYLPVPGFCGDGICGADETACTCSDCGFIPSSENLCDDNLDDDCDGDVDCDDTDCIGHSACSDCGDGVCTPGEDCTNCEADCPGQTNGRPNSRYCCGNGIVESRELLNPGICDGNN